MSTAEIMALLGIVGLLLTLGGVVVRADRRLTRVESTLTQNGGRNNPPTVLDKLHGIDKKLDVHLAEAQHDREDLAELRDRILRLERK